MPARAEQRDRAVDAAAHRDGDAPGIKLGAEYRPERVRERVDGELVAPHGGSLEERQAGERAVKPFRLGADDPVPLDRQADERPTVVAGGVSGDLDHHPRLARRKANGGPKPPARCSTLPLPEPVANLD